MWSRKTTYMYQEKDYYATIRDEVSSKSSYITVNHIISIRSPPDAPNTYYTKGPNDLEITLHVLYGSYLLLDWESEFITGNAEITSKLRKLLF